MDNEDYVNVFIDMMKEAMPDKVVTNFVFVAEIVSNEDNRLNIITSNGMTPWLAQGMLNAAEDMILSGVDSFVDDPEEDQ
jgi:hypothetical protein